MDIEIILKELQFKAVRSSGAGGQHVNKVSSKVALAFDLDRSKGLTEEEKSLLQKNLISKLTKQNILLMQCAESRSQHTNKSLLIKRFTQLIISGLKVPRKRKATKPDKASIKKRLEEKKKQSTKKTLRKKINDND